MTAYSDTVSRLAGTGRCAVCFSGGFDSTFLLKAAFEALGEGCVGVFADIPLISDRQRRAAAAVADAIGANIVIVRLGWEDMPGVEDNGPDRCYRCKRAIYGAVREAADGLGIGDVLCGDNADDAGLERPGRRAREELGVLAPLEELEIRKEEIVSSVSGWELGTWMIKDTCMATRIPCGTPIGEVSMRFVENCESIVREVTGIRQVRFRIDGDSAEIQTSDAEVGRLQDASERLSEAFGAMGVTVKTRSDGYREL